MSLDFHSPRGPVDLSDMVLTSSVDWTVRLWRVRSPSSTSATTTGTSSTTSNILPGQSNSSVQDIHSIVEFSREDVVYDARWSPQKPGVFALVDGAGSVEVWDLLSDIEIPVTKATPSTNKRLTGLSGGYVPKSLNKVAWDEKDGKRLGVGGANGMVTAFDVGSGLSGESARAEEWAGVKRLMGKMERGGR
jgi:dynein intermediate chain, cytosolic